MLFRFALLVIGMTFLLPVSRSEAQAELVPPAHLTLTELPTA